MSDSAVVDRHRSESRSARTRTRSLSLQRRATLSHTPPASKQSSELPEQFKKRRSPRPLPSSSEESLDVAGVDDIGHMAQYSEELAAVKNQVEAMRDEVSDSRRALLRSGSEIAKLTLILDAKTAELTALRKEHEDSLNVLQSEKERLEATVAAEKQNAADGMELLRARRLEVESLKSQIAGLEAANEKMQVEIETLKMGSEKDASLFTATRKALEGATTYQDELQSIAEDFERKHEANERKIAQLTIELDDYKDDYEHLFGKYKKQCEKLEKMRSFYDRSVEDLRQLRSRSPAVSLSEYDGPQYRRAMAHQREEAGSSIKPAMAASHVASKRALKAKDFPKKTAEMSFTIYFESLQNYVGHLLDSGYDDAVVAEELFQALSQGSLASPFLHRYKRERRLEVLTTAFLMQTLEKVDFAYHNLSAEDRYRVVRIREGEANVDYLQRCEREHDAIFPDQTDREKRFYEIKRRFIEGGNFPIWQQDRLRPYATLRELLFGAETLSTRESQRQRQAQGRPRQQNNNAPVARQPTAPVANPAALPARPAADPFLAQAQFQAQNADSGMDNGRGFVAAATPPASADPPVLKTYSMRDGSISFRPPPRNRLAAPVGAVRAPLDAEFGDQKFSFCGNCRMFTHPTAVCHYKSFCSRCQIEGQHEDRKCPQRPGQAQQPPNRLG